MSGKQKEIPQYLTNSETVERPSLGIIVTGTLYGCANWQDMCREEK